MPYVLLLASYYLYLATCVLRLATYILYLATPVLPLNKQFLSTFGAMSLLTRFLNFIHENQLFEKNERILLAVSGGKDSVLMVHLFAKAGYSFGIAHCNFKLRGENSEKDEALVFDLAHQLNLSLIHI